MSEYRRLVAFNNIQQMLAPNLPNVTIDEVTFSMDTADLDSFCDDAKLAPIRSQILSEGALSFFASQTFIGFQISALIAQNWLVNKACTQKVRDAVKSWYVPTINDGDEGVDAEIITTIKKMDKRMGLKKNLIQAGRFNNIFGIRHILFEYEGVDYEKPFNPDGIKPGSYKGMTQIDPYWLAPYLSGKDVSDPTSQTFYDPEHWVVGGRGKIHRSHFIILRGPEVADYLKPAYYYGGLGLPQLIFDRAYAAERTANEAPQVAMSKRLNVRKVDLEKVAADPAAFEEALSDLVNFRDSFGVHVIDTSEDHQQFDTTLTDFDSVIMTQYQIAAAISNTPATKLMGTAPKGFNATGEFEIESYHEELESIQEMDLSPIIERHNLCVMKSVIKPEFGKEYEVDVIWNPIKVESRKEKAEINEIQSRTDRNYIESGAVSQEEVRRRLINDPDSGYSGLEEIDQDEIEEEFGLSDEPDDDPQESAEDEIEKEGDKYFVYSTTGKKLSKGYPSRREAYERLREIEYFKRSGDEFISALAEDEEVTDAEYKGNAVKLNKPFRNGKGKSKYAVYVKNDKGNVVKVSFGDPNMEIRRDNPKARKNFRARHNCSEKTDNTTAGYWSCKLWSDKPVSEIVS